MNPQHDALLPLLLMMAKNDPRHIDQALSSGQVGALALHGAANPVVDAINRRGNGTVSVPMQAEEQRLNSTNANNPLLMMMGGSNAAK